jgi:hypothetical protein
MKKLLIVLATGLGIVVACQTSQHNGRQKVTIDKEHIVLPGAAVSSEDHKAMNKILKQYDKSLYRVDTYEKGQLARTQGTLSEVVIGRKLVSEVAENAKKMGFGQYAIQIGIPEGVGHATPTPGLTVGGTGHATPTPGLTIGGNPHVPSPSPGASIGGTGHKPPKAQDAMDSEELVKRLQPILEKYSKQ